MSANDSVQSLAPSPKLSSVTDRFFMPDDLKAGWKISRLFTTQDQYSFNLPFLCPRGHISSHLTGFCPPTLLFDSPLSLLFYFQHGLVTIQHVFFWNSPVNIHHTRVCRMAFPKHRGPTNQGPTFLSPGDKDLCLAVRMTNVTQRTDFTWVLTSFCANWGQQYPPCFYPLQAWSVENEKALGVKSYIWNF